MYADILLTNVFFSMPSILRLRFDSFPHTLCVQNPQMLSQMLANNNMMMNLASNNNNSSSNNNNISGSGSNCNTPSLNMGGVGTPQQIPFFPTSSSATPSAGGTGTPGGGTLTGGGANGAPPMTSASPGNPPLKQTAGNGQLPISMSNGGLTI